MKKVTTIAAALLLLGSSAALAQSYDNPRDENRRDVVEQDRNHRDEARDQVRDAPHWSRGDRLPEEYLGREHFVTDWRASHLRPPPRGYHWVRAENRYVLAHNTRGTVLEIIENHERR